MIRFECDYLEGAHPRILERLAKTNMEQTRGYGLDPHCERARELIREAFACPGAEVQFLVGGTQANLTVIASALRPYQGVLCASTGHINVHETGAVEATGHKVLPLESEDGKITAAQVEAACRSHREDANAEHMAQPGMAYVSNPTEVGTIYRKEELRALHEACRAYGIPLFLDGARLGYGLMARGNDVAPRDLPSLCDVFTIGGTKVGALFGEAVVLPDGALGKGFRYSVKQRGGMLAKGRLLGVQFETLFEDGLYFHISGHAIRMAMLLKDALEGYGYAALIPSPTNQQFPILPDRKLEELSGKYSFEPWGRVDASHRAVRVCTSWATKEEDVRALIRDLAP